MPGSTSSTPLTCTPAVFRKRSPARALQGRRDDVVLATKFFMPMDDRPNHSGGSRKWIMQEAENSLRRLKTDYIDLYQVHRPSATTDVEETLGALTDLVHQGSSKFNSDPASDI